MSKNKKNFAPAASAPHVARVQFVNQFWGIPVVDIVALEKVNQIWNDAVNDSVSKLHEAQKMSSDAFQRLVARPFEVNINLDSPQLVFTITNLDQDPTKMEEDFREFLAKTFAEGLTFSFKRKPVTSQFAYSTASAPAPPTLLPARIKWNLAAFQSEKSNDKWIVTIKVPLF